MRSGDLVRVALSIEAPPWQKNLVIEDLLPAGLEIENPRLETSARSNQADETGGGDERLENSHVDYRDDRIVVAGSIGAKAVAHFTYLARAVTPGTYVVPPVRGECMYDTGMNSINGGGGTLVVQSPQAAGIARDE